MMTLASNYVIKGGSNNFSLFLQLPNSFSLLSIINKQHVTVSRNDLTAGDLFMLNK